MESKLGKTLKHKAPQKNMPAMRGTTQCTLQGSAICKTELSLLTGERIRAKNTEIIGKQISKNYCEL